MMTEGLGPLVASNPVRRQNVTLLSLLCGVTLIIVITTARGMLEHLATVLVIQPGATSMMQAGITPAPVFGALIKKQM